MDLKKLQLLPLLPKTTENTGKYLTKSLCNVPHHNHLQMLFQAPQSQYFGIGKITNDQFEDYAKRKGWDKEEAERWLRPNLE